MKAADEMVDIIRDIIRQELNGTDSTVLCQVSSKTDDNHYNLFVVPDGDRIIENVVNMTKFDLDPGDLCYVYKIGNRLANAFICYKLTPFTGIVSAPEQETTSIIAETEIVVNNTGHKLIISATPSSDIVVYKSNGTQLVLSSGETYVSKVISNVTAVRFPERHTPIPISGTAVTVGSDDSYRLLLTDYTVSVMVVPM